MLKVRVALGALGVVAALCGVAAPGQAARVVAPAGEPLTGAAAVAAAQRMAGCHGCGSLSRGARPATGLASVLISDSAGGGFVMIMGHTGNRWGLLQAGQDSPYVSALPGRLLICQAPGNRTNVRSGPGTGYRVVAKVTRPTRVSASRFRLARSGRVSSSAGADGEGWYRVRVGGRTGWVASRLTYLPDSASGGCTSWLAWPWPDGSSKT